MKNVELLVRLLGQAGVRWVFGVPSGPVLPLIEALSRGSPEFVLTTSEASAGFMAQTIGNLTGIPGVCVSTLGPGATNLATGVGSAWLDRSPLIAITCNVPTPWIKRRVQMRIDHHELFRPLTKATWPLRSGEVGKTLAGALALAMAEPPGPVHLDLPEDVALDEADEAPEAPRLANAGPGGSNEVAKKIAEALKRGRRPLLVIGLTFARQREARRLLEFVERQNLPFASTLHAKGVLPESHPNWVGVLGRARRSDIQAFVNRADLIVAVGYDPVELNYEEWVGNIPLIHASTEVAEASPGLSFWLNEACDLDRLIRSMSELPTVENDWTQTEFASHRKALDPDSPPHYFGVPCRPARDEKELRNAIDWGLSLAARAS